jgi:hypothetical protein
MIPVIAELSASFEWAAKARARLARSFFAEEIEPNVR